MDNIGIFEGGQIMIEIEKLKKHEIFSDLTDAELEVIGEMAKKVTYGPNKRIFEEKSLAANLYLVLDGKVEIRMSGDKSGKQIPVSAIEPDEIFGWSAVTEPFTFTAAAWTLEPSELLVLNGKVLLDLFKKNNHIGYKIMMKIASVISSRLKHLSQKLADSQ
jgi:CRP-like cAMP-binding protein